MLDVKHIPIFWKMQAEFHNFGIFLAMEFKNRLREWLKEEGLSPESLAKLIPFGKSQIYNYLNGKNDPSMSFFSALGKEFPSLNLSWLLTGNGSMYKPHNNGGVNHVVSGNGNIYVGGRVSGSPKIGGIHYNEQTREKSPNWQAVDKVTINNVMHILEDYLAPPVLREVKERLQKTKNN